MCSEAKGFVSKSTIVQFYVRCAIEVDWMCKYMKELWMVKFISPEIVHEETTKQKAIVNLRFCMACINLNEHGWGSEGWVCFKTLQFQHGPQLQNLRVLSLN